MSATINHEPASVPAAPPLARSGSLVARLRRPRQSSETAAERAWLQQGFAPPQPDLEDYLARPAPSLLCNTHRIAVALFLTMILLASIIHVDVIVAGTGRLSMDSPTIVLQPMQLSVIRQIRVKPGEVVRKGDLLASLDPTFAQADRAVLLAQQSAIRAQQGRLEAELDGTPFEPESGSQELMLQRALYRQRQAQFTSRLADIDQRLRSHEIEVATAQATRELLTQQVALAREVESMRNTLFRSQSGSRLNYVEAQAARVRNERELQAAIAQINTAQQAILSLKADRQAFIDSWRRELTEQLVKTRADSLAVDENLSKADLVNRLVELTAPEDGVVLEVAKRSVGSVLNAAEPLITMIPSSAAMIAEIAIGSADIGYTKPGDEVRVKVDAFPYQRHGLLTGRLRAIVADSAPSPAGAAGGSTAFHRAVVELRDSTLQGMPEGARLIPGMTLAAEIRVGTRTVISYILYPIMRSISESLREP
ncbi:HlyD family type I secretion periplasmic adaptor subunit [Muricoccus aerilatus]|uniref:HlyD family type I secretion periplasmic adaptor subunit n=1 Tax=Muricoccus aerilatus TaxID=452982 RepID=UPI000693CEC4|nr:HlyD family type I secretion periplasmic adaptor subunit [Roseomonas aerilata]